MFVRVYKICPVENSYKTVENFYHPVENSSLSCGKLSQTCGKPHKIVEYLWKTLRLSVENLYRPVENSSCSSNYDTPGTVILHTLGIVYNNIKQFSIIFNIL